MGSLVQRRPSAELVIGRGWLGDIFWGPGTAAALMTCSRSWATLLVAVPPCLLAAYRVWRTLHRALLSVQVPA